MKKRKKTEIAIKDQSTEITGSVFDNQVHRAVAKIANILSGSKLVPVHLQGKPDDCFLVTQQAYRWGIDPFAVAQCSSVVHGKICYEGKLVAAVVEKLSGVILDYKYSGVGLNRQLTVLGQRKGDTEPKTIEIILKDVQVSTNPKWASMTDQMLAYRGTREWARRWTPGALLGVYTVDELLDDKKFVDITPKTDPVMDRLKQEKGEKLPEISDVEVEDMQNTAETFIGVMGSEQVKTEQKEINQEITAIVTSNDEPKQEVLSQSFDLKIFRLKAFGVTGRKEFTSLQDAQANLKLKMQAQTTKSARGCLIDENKELISAIDSAGLYPLTTEIYELKNQGE